MSDTHTLSITPTPLSPCSPHSPHSPLSPHSTASSSYDFHVDTRHESTYSPPVECLRWLIHVTEHDYDLAAFTALLKLLNCESAEQQRICRFQRPLDRMRCLIGRLALRAAVCQLNGERWNEVQIQRSPFGKPEHFSPANRRRLSLNISHTGEFVFCAAQFDNQQHTPKQIPSPKYIIDSPKHFMESPEHQTLQNVLHTVHLGCDIVDFTRPLSNESVEHIFSLFQHCFTQTEWIFIKIEDNNTKHNTELISDLSVVSLRRLYVWWCYKEAVIKALGFGLTMKLGDFQVLPLEQSLSPSDDCTQIDFTIEAADDSDSAIATLFNNECWTFEHCRVDDEHFAVVAIYQSTDAPDSNDSAMCDSQLSSGLNAMRFTLNEFHKFVKAMT